MILLTGASGFVGRRLLRKLQEAYGPQATIAWTSEEIEGARCALHEGYSAATLQFPRIKPDEITTVIHAGAAVHDVNDEKAAARNVEVTKLLLDADLPRLERFVYLSTIDVYDKSGIISEAAPLAPHNAYSQSKATCEALVTDWAKDRQLIGQILRVGHVYGPGEERHRKVIPLMIRTIMRGEAPKVFGEGRERRAFIYVDDVARAIVAALKLTDDIGPINIASRRSISMIELAQLLLEIAGSEQLVERLPAGVAGGDVVFDAAKCARYLLDDELPLRDGLTREWEYMRGLRE